MVERVLCNSTSNFESLFNECSKSSPTFYVLFTGSKTNGRSWCGDCTAAEPVINSALGEIEGGCKLLVVDCPREEYRKQDYAYRVNPKISLRCVPTLMKWSNGKLVGRLNDSQSQSSALVKELIDSE